ADNGFSGTAGQHENTASTVRTTSAVKQLRCFLLIFAKAERPAFGSRFAKLYIERIAVNKTGQVLYRVTLLDEGLFKTPAHVRPDGNLKIIDADFKQFPDCRCSKDFFGDCALTTTEE